jgi:hypothetical protein
MARPKGAKDKAPRKTAAAKQATLAASEGLTPLEFMLSVMRDTDKELSYRLDMAKAAAPYVHARLSSIEMGGKDDGPIKIEIVKFDPAAK